MRSLNIHKSLHSLSVSRGSTLPICICRPPPPSTRLPFRLQVACMVRRNWYHIIQLFIIKFRVALHALPTQAHPRRVAKVQSQVQREISDMLHYDTVSTIMTHRTVIWTCTTCIGSSQIRYPKLMTIPAPYGMHACTSKSAKAIL